jgi:hypothetical protein
MDSFPIDIISIITGNMKNYKDLHSLKLSCKYFNEIITRYSIIKQKIYYNLNKKEKIIYCANSNCYNETKDIFVDYYREYEGRYIHHHQYAINSIIIYINQKTYKIFSPYCCECYKKYILFGDKKENLVREIQVEGFVDIEYTDAKDYIIES